MIDCSYILYILDELQFAAGVIYIIIDLHKKMRGMNIYWVWMVI